MRTLPPPDKREYPTVICPYCKAVLMRANMGVCAHLKQHIRAGELRSQDELSIRLSILGRTKRESTV